MIRPRINLCDPHYRQAISNKRPEVQDQVFVRDNATCDWVNCIARAIYRVSTQLTVWDNAQTANNDKGN